MRRMLNCGAALLAAFLGFGLAGTATAQTPTDVRPADATQADAQADEGLEVRVERTVRALTGQLGLSEDQALRLRPVLTDHQRAVRDLRKRWTSADATEAEARAGFRAELLELRTDLRGELATVLTPDQIDRFEELRRENRRRGVAAQEPE